MRNVVRVLLAVAVVAVSGQVSWAQSFRGADSKVTGNFNGIYSTMPRTYRSYSYVAPTTAAVVNAPVVVNTAPRATAVAPTPAPQPAVVAAPPVRTQATAPVQTQQAQNQVRTQRSYSYQPSIQGNVGVRSMRCYSHDPSRPRADFKVLGN
jgi:hypothetical protein